MRFGMLLLYHVTASHALRQLPQPRHRVALVPGHSSRSAPVACICSAGDMGS